MGTWKRMVREHAGACGVCAADTVWRRASAASVCHAFVCHVLDVPTPTRCCMNAPRGRAQVLPGVLT